MGWASCIEDIIERACEIEHMRRNNNPDRIRFQSGVDTCVISISEITANRKHPGYSKPEPIPPIYAPAKRNHLKEKAQYLKLIERERGLLGDVRIESDVVYWPIGVVESLHRDIDSLSTDILRFVQAGYHQKSALLKRLNNRAEVQYRIDWLVANGWLEQLSLSEGEINLRVLQTGPVFLRSETSLAYFDAITGIQIELPEGTALLNREQLDESAPVMAERDWRETEENVKFLECLAMLIFSGRQNARSVRVYNGFNDVVSLQEIFYDLAMGKSLRLATTSLSECIAPASQ